MEHESLLEPDVGKLVAELGGLRKDGLASVTPTSAPHLTALLKATYDDSLLPLGELAVQAAREALSRLPGREARANAWLLWIDLDEPYERADLPVPKLGAVRRPEAAAIMNRTAKSLERRIENKILLPMLVDQLRVPKAAAGSERDGRGQRNVGKLVPARHKNAIKALNLFYKDTVRLAAIGLSYQYVSETSRALEVDGRLDQYCHHDWLFRNAQFDAYCAFIISADHCLSSAAHAIQTEVRDYLSDKRFGAVVDAVSLVKRHMVQRRVYSAKLNMGRMMIEGAELGLRLSGKRGLVDHRAARVMLREWLPRYIGASSPTGPVLTPEVVERSLGLVEGQTRVCVGIAWVLENYVEATAPWLTGSPIAPAFATKLVSTYFGVNSDHKIAGFPLHLDLGLHFRDNVRNAGR